MCEIVHWQLSYFDPMKDFFFDEWISINELSVLRPMIKFTESLFLYLNSQKWKSIGTKHGTTEKAFIARGTYE